MSNITEGIFIGAASIVFASFLTYVVVVMARMWHVPKRVDRLDSAIPIVMEVLGAVLENQIAVIICTQNKACNGELERAMELARGMKEKMSRFLSGSVVSQKEAR